jgi:hypothetical protein
VIIYESNWQFIIDYALSHLDDYLKLTPSERAYSSVDYNEVLNAYFTSISRMLGIKFHNSFHSFLEEVLSYEGYCQLLQIVTDNIQILFSF